RRARPALATIKLAGEAARISFGGEEARADPIAAHGRVTAGRVLRALVAHRRGGRRADRRAGRRRLARSRTERRFRHTHTTSAAGHDRAEAPCWTLAGVVARHQVAARGSALHAHPAPF